jgi:hypothetical protein
MMDHARTRWDGDFAGNEAGYPINGNPYLEHIERPPPSSGRLITDLLDIDKHRNLATLRDALDLIVDLWPKPGYSTVQLESHQWIKLRRVLLEIPHLVAADE